MTNGARRIVATLTQLIESPARSARLLERIGHPAAYNDEIALLQGGLLLRSEQSDGVLLRRLLALSLARRPITGRPGEGRRVRACSDTPSARRMQ